MIVHAIYASVGFMFGVMVMGLLASRKIDELQEYIRRIKRWGRD